MTGRPGPPAVPPSRPPASFQEEVARAVRYERGLALKAVAALAVVAAVLVVHVLLFA